ncbi:MAG: hypothetical protein LBJ12_09805 [Oscillospiraceae bacterium]|jgi:transposase|nr:hypothetical protein [Oscillospiraceae bacterium]
MPAPLSKDIRKRIIEAKERGDTIVKIAGEKGISESAVLRILMLYRETGSYEPRPNRRGGNPRLTLEQLIQIQEKISEQPNISLLELKDVLALPVCESALCRIVNKKLGLRRKKRFTQPNRAVKMLNRNEKIGGFFSKPLILSNSFSWMKAA